MNIPIINSIVSYLRGDGAVILPEIELVLFGLGILVIDFWIEQKEKYMNAGLALAGTLFSAFTLWRLRTAVAARGEFAGFHDSVVESCEFAPGGDCRAEPPEREGTK